MVTPISKASVGLPEPEESDREKAAQPGPALGPLGVLTQSVLMTTYRSDIC